jgi:hypothetical protein
MADCGSGRGSAFRTHKPVHSPECGAKDAKAAARDSGVRLQTACSGPAPAMARRVGVAGEGPADLACRAMGAKIYTTPPPSGHLFP